LANQQFVTDSNKRGQGCFQENLFLQIYCILVDKLVYHENTEL
jgi:hypothetical protein